MLICEQGYTQKKSFIIAQSPMKNTLNDFVKMLYQRECGVVVMLCGCEEGGVEMCAQYWPSSVGRSTKYGDLVVSTTKIDKAREGLIKRTITIKRPKVKKSQCYFDYFSTFNLQSSSVREVIQLQIESWSCANTHSNPKELIDSINQITETQTNSKVNHIVVHGR